MRFWPPSLDRGRIRKAGPALVAVKETGRRQSYPCTHALEEFFDNALLDGPTLGELPDVPSRCVNATILNNGQVAEFDRHGFSAWDADVLGSNPSQLDPMSSLPLSLAVVASASFPISLPPFVLYIETFPIGPNCPSSFTKPGSIYGRWRSP